MNKTDKNKNIPEVLPEFSISNFRIFENKETFKFAPITILTGTNSSGKSSLLTLIKQLKKNFEPTGNFFNQGEEKSFLIKIFSAEFASIYGDEKIKNNITNYNSTSDNTVLTIKYEYEPYNSIFDLNLSFTFTKNETNQNTRLTKISIAIEKIKHNEQTEFMCDYIKNIATINLFELEGTELYFLESIPESRFHFGHFTVTQKVDLFALFDIASKASQTANNSNSTEHMDQTKEIISLNDWLSNNEAAIIKANKIINKNYYGSELEKQIKFQIDLYSYIVNYMDDHNSHKINKINYSFQDFIELIHKQSKNIFIGFRQPRFISAFRPLCCNKSSEEYHNEVFIPFCELLKSVENFKNSNFDNREIIHFSFSGSVGWSIANFLKAINRVHDDKFNKNEDGTYRVEGKEHREILENQDLIKFLNEFVNLSNIAEEVKIVFNPNKSSFGISLLKNDRWTDITDEGSGIVRLIPILFTMNPIDEGKVLNELNNYPKSEEGSYSENKFFYAKTILLEEPEAKLHPALQSKLADFFVNAYLNLNISFIIETHSEYLIRRLQYLTLKIEELDTDDTQIYYFYPPNKIPIGEKQIFPININKNNGSLTKNFGVGFMDEAGLLDLSIAQINRLNRN